MKTTRIKRLVPFLGLVCACALSTDSLKAQVAGGGAARTARSATAYPSSTEVGEAMISVDTETRNLIVITDEETAEQIRDVVASLDRSPPQVLINVVFLEVTHRKGLDLGVDITYSRNFGEGDEYSASASQTFRNLASLRVGVAAFTQLPGVSLRSRCVPWRRKERSKSCPGPRS
jgi:type II secretory pathway component GspD/PulD (secretin)